MQNRHFVNRAEELAFLERQWASKEPSFAVLYGRRRVGKTELISHFADDKPHLYFLCDKRGTASNAHRFSLRISEHFGEPPAPYDQFDDAFQYLSKRLGGRKMAVLIDEFSYLVEKDDSIPSVFQLVWDQNLSQTNVMLILCGSSISMMRKGVLSHESPLYGRRTGQWKAEPLQFKHVMKFFPKTPIGRIIEYYALAGGIPQYLLKLDAQLDLKSNITKNVFTKGTFLYEETSLLLSEELREPATYYSILSAMSNETRLTDIANKAGVPAKDMPKYLDVLIDLEYVERLIPVTEDTSKRSLYRIKDNFFNFWFRFAAPNMSDLESGRQGPVMEKIAPELQKYVSRVVFEDVCQQALAHDVGAKFDTFGKWWGNYRDGGEKKTQDIDIVFLNKKTGDILFAECKWSDGVDAKVVLGELKAKTAHVQWRDEYRKEHFAVFAKSFRRKEDLGKNVALYDLKKMEKVFSAR